MDAESGDDDTDELTSEWESKSLDMTGEADEMNLGVDSRDEMMRENSHNN